MTSKARTAWIGLGLRRRRQVIRLAKKGQLHSDPIVAATSLAWAAETMGVQLSPRSDWVAAGLMEALVSLVTDNAGLGSVSLGAAGGRWAERRLARRILEARPSPAT